MPFGAHRRTSTEPRITLIVGEERAEAYIPLCLRTAVYGPDAKRMHDVNIRRPKVPMTACLLRPETAVQRLWDGT